MRRWIVPSCGTHPHSPESMPTNALTGRSCRIRRFIGLEGWSGSDYFCRLEELKGLQAGSSVAID